MTVLFADTYYFLAIISPGDAGHQKAQLFGENDDRPILTTAWVLTEVADGLADTRNRHLARQLYLDLQNAPLDQVVSASHDLFERGMHLYDDRADKSWSLTDCISFVVMQDHGITEALTADRHFEQAGYTPLLA
jgi:predicted nucleic acid-binding protein